jgi:hypothetical protein
MGAAIVHGLHAGVRHGRCKFMSEDQITVKTGVIHISFLILSIFAGGLHFTESTSCLPPIILAMMMRWASRGPVVG